MSAHASVRAEAARDVALAEISNARCLVRSNRAADRPRRPMLAVVPPESDLSVTIPTAVALTRAIAGRVEMRAVRAALVHPAGRPTATHAVPAYVVNAGWPLRRTAIVPLTVRLQARAERVGRRLMAPFSGPTHPLPFTYSGALLPGFNFAPDQIASDFTNGLSLRVRKTEEQDAKSRNNTQSKHSTLPQRCQNVCHG